MALMWKAASLTGLWLAMSALPAFAADDIKVETIISDLNHPASIAIRPGQAEVYEIFISESGARRVIKTASNTPNDSAVVITGFPDPSDSGKYSNIGNPGCLLFLDRDRLVVGVAGRQAEVRLYQLSDAKDELIADQSVQEVVVELLGDSVDQTPRRCPAFARSRANAVVDDMLLFPYSPIPYIPIRAGSLGELRRLEPEDDPVNPVALAVSEQGYLVVADGGYRTARQGLKFLNPATGRTVMSSGVTSLKDIRGLAYSPKSGNLYAIAREYGADDNGSVFRIDGTGLTRPGSIAFDAALVRVAKAVGPTALAFGPDGVLYVTASGDPNAAATKRGVLLKITGEL